MIHHQVIADIIVPHRWHRRWGQIQPVHTHHVGSNPTTRKIAAGNGQQDRQLLGVADHFPRLWGWRIRSRRGCTNGRQHIAGLGAAGAQGRAVAAVVAQPDVAAADQTVLEPPGCGNHFLSGKRFGIRGDGTGHRACGALEALFDIGSASRLTSLIKPTSGSTRYEFAIVKPPHLAKTGGKGGDDRLSIVSFRIRSP
jgi:hypothetical protein